VIPFLVSWVFDPMANDLVTEYKAKRLAVKHEIVTIGMARHAVHRGCKYFIKVPKENADPARAQLVNWYGNIGAFGLVFYGDGKIFLGDESHYFMINMLYS